MATPRDELHRLIDELPETALQPVLHTIAARQSAPATAMTAPAEGSAAAWLDLPSLEPARDSLADTVDRLMAMVEAWRRPNGSAERAAQ